jgi:hypothetical protein
MPRLYGIFFEEISQAGEGGSPSAVSCSAYFVRVTVTRAVAAAGTGKFTIDP